MIDALKRSLPPFVSAAVRSPMTVGAAAPSSRALAAQMASAIPDVEAPTIVEVGAGTGALTRLLHEKGPHSGRHLAVELDERMAEYLERSFPGVEVVHGDAAELGKLLADRGVTAVDAMLCGLPWSLFTSDLQRRLLDEITAPMAPHGVFTTFAYLHATRVPGAKRFRAAAEATFEDVRVQAPVWRNLPPALTYVCRGVRRDD